MNKIGFGGSCHWCTEAIFLSLNGVKSVDQGWISSLNENSEFSEAVVVHFDEDIITLENLIEIHLHTHSCTAEHSMRKKYRSAIYIFSTFQQQESILAIKKFQVDFIQPIITKVISFDKFKLNTNQYLNYYYNDPEKPFCENIVNPKLQKLIASFPKNINREKIDFLEKLSNPSSKIRRVK